MSFYYAAVGPTLRVLRSSSSHGNYTHAALWASIDESGGLSNDHVSSSFSSSLLRARRVVHWMTRPPNSSRYRVEVVAVRLITREEYNDLRAPILAAQRQRRAEKKRLQSPWPATAGSKWEDKI